MQLTLRLYSRTRCTDWVLEAPSTSTDMRGVIAPLCACEAWFQAAGAGVPTKAEASAEKWVGGPGVSQLLLTCTARTRTGETTPREVLVPTLATGTGPCRGVNAPVGVGVSLLLGIENDTDEDAGPDGKGVEVAGYPMATDWTAAGACSTRVPRLDGTGVSQLLLRCAMRIRTGDTTRASTVFPGVGKGAWMWHDGLLPGGCGGCGCGCNWGCC
mmetsp:Transcript_135895/g.338922  ORF Transcript_135895/g.338922 Transcript_135895/m.338922 type:complete len:214 (-) Transcript_135895:499-1140(-)